MPLVTSEKMLLDVQSGNYAVGAFNVENMEMVMAVIQAAEEMRSPVIICKVNYATDLRIAFSKGVKHYMLRAKLLSVAVQERHKERNEI